MTHVGDSQSVRSVSLCGSMRFADGSAYHLTPPFDSVSSAAPFEEDQGLDPDLRQSAGVGRSFYDGGKDGSVDGSAASVCRSFATGCCASTPAEWTRLRRWEVTGRILAKLKRRSRPARSRRPTAWCAGRRKDLSAVARDVRHLREPPLGQVLRRRQRHYAVERAGPGEASPPNWRRSGRGSAESARLWSAS